MKEVWRDIIGYKGIYQVSNLGRVKSLPKVHRTGNNGYRNRKEYLLSDKANTRYLTVGLRKNGKQKHILVHRLVALAFVENPDDKPYVDHIDGNNHNNRADNLRWVTPLENSANPVTKKRHFNVMQKFKGRIGVKSLTYKAVLQYSIDGRFIKRWECMSDAARFYGINSSGISHVIRGDQDTSAGYLWRLADKEPDINIARLNVTGY